MSDSHRDRVEKLVALALNNPSEHEAASAALAACRLIREYKMLESPSFQAPTEPSDAYRQWADPPSGYNYQPHWYQSTKAQEDFARIFEMYSQAAAARKP